MNGSTISSECRLIYQWECSSPKCGVCNEAKPVIVPASTGFNWAAAGIKPPVKSGWTCGVCSCQNTEG